MKNSAWAFVLTILGLVAHDCCIAQAYPSRPVRVIVAFAPGGLTDAVARRIGGELSKRHSQTFVIENRPGESGRTGRQLVAKSSPDGYTILVDAAEAGDTDLVEIANVGTGGLILVVHASTPARSVAELVVLARKQPGKLNYATSGVGSQFHIAMALFAAEANINLTNIPYKGGGSAMVALLSGEVAAMFVPFGPGIPHIKSGRLRALGVSLPKRSPDFPHVPTIGESGFPGYQFLTPIGVFVPRSVPGQTQQELRRSIGEMLRTSEYRQFLRENYLAFGPSDAGQNEPTCKDGYKWCKCKSQCIPQNDSCDTKCRVLGISPL